MNIAYEIERLIQFGQKKNLIEKIDAIIVRNQLLNLFQVNEPYPGNVTDEDLQYPSGILEKMLNYAVENQLLDQNNLIYRDLFDTKIMGLLMPRESELIFKFNDLASKDVIKATDYFYHISLISNYIRMDRIKKNLGWKFQNEYGEFDITINLSKPEKDPKLIALEKTQPQTDYPKCLLCLENIGYVGRVNFPARQNLRVIPINLAGEQWYLQYSPYVYYNEHCIVFSEEHRPMLLDHKTFERLFDFIKQFPHYMCGSNADLPIVGGSLLSHDHYQGGRYIFPLQKAAITQCFSHSQYPEISIATIKWPLSVVRASSGNIPSLVDFSAYVLSKWREYSDEEVDVFAHSENNGEKTHHNTITPIVRINSKGKYEIDLVLRNNRTTKEHPDGLFHPHQEIHHIKKENIGLIEVMGLAILPGRLYQEIDRVKEILTEKKPVEDINNKEHPLNKHLPWIKEISEKYHNKISEEQVDQILKEEIGMRFKTCLEHTGIFKQNLKGQAVFIKFLDQIGCNQIDSP